MEWIADAVLVVLMVGCYALVVRNNDEVSETLATHRKETAEELGRIYEIMNNHKQDAGIHTEKSEFVAAAVCAERHKALDEKMTAMNKTLSDISSDVKQILKGSHNA